MKNKIKKFSIVAAFVLGLGVFTWQSNAADVILMSMQNQNVNVDEAYQQARIDSKAEGFFDIINSELLEKDYSYDKNKKVKEEVDKQIKSIKENNPDAVKEYAVKDEMDLLKKTGSFLQIQEEQYTKDTYQKLYVNNKTLKKLYDEKAGEMTSYYVIKIDDSMFEGDTEKIEKAKTEIEEKLKNATKDDIKDIYKELIKTYPGSDEDKNGEKSVSREEVEEKLLKTLDRYKYLQFNKKAIEIDGVNYYILKTDKGERATFAASKERLKDLQFEKAVQENSYLTEYLLVQFRAKGNINFANSSDKMIYDAATNKIIADYKDAKDGAN
ncbi:uncharacterized protein YdbL (DUF1318 family) [Bacilli bacterium PM5-3]|nr:uncharacterized protein YdbL (DUF1318 family) [Bacilli bacterium PM5-3]MDH6603745.1 uncharacterized protein YdbL (DUF1318 family) [Bacilli bacterium PM5-9]